jgi:hypothetical protein
VQGLLPTCLLEQFDLWQNEDDSLSGIPKYANKARQRQRLSILSRSLPEESAAAIESLNAAAGTQQVGMSVLRVRLHKVDHAIVLIILLVHYTMLLSLLLILWYTLEFHRYCMMFMPDSYIHLYALHEAANVTVTYSAMLCIPLLYCQFAITVTVTIIGSVSTI